MAGSLRIGVTLGCPSGVGAEVVLKALAKGRHPPAVLFGAPSSWADAQKVTGITLPAPLVENDALPTFAGPLCLVPSASTKQRFRRGKPDAEADAATSRALLDAVEAMREGDIHAVATAPARKQAFEHLPGGPFPGHTEFFHHHFGQSPSPVMLFVAPGMRLGLLTIHLPLREVPAAVTTENLLAALGTMSRGLWSDLGILNARIHVLGLNPHASEDGRIGDEDPRIVRPALERARSEGLLVEGPFPADGYFARYRERPPPDAILALFHDQGLGPFKLWERGRGCQMTLGLSVPRTSCDHGTAYDIAGRGIADAASMAAAVRLAAQVVRVRRQREGKTGLTRSARAR